MGARLVRTIDWTSRISRAGLAVSVAVVAIGTARDFGYAVPLDVAIARTLSAVAPAGTLDFKAAAALDAEDVALARGYADLATELGRSLKPETLARLTEAEAPGATAWRNARGAAWGFATGSADGPAALAGSVAADLTVVGDVRDLVGEGAKIARGEEHSDLLLGLAAAGLAATAVTYASGGGAAPIRFGVSVLKAARRAGTLTVEFTAHLGRVLAKAIDVGRVETTALRAGRGVERASLAGVRAADDAPGLAKVAGDLRATSSVVGAGETVQLLRFVRTGDDLAELAPFATRFGVKARAVATLTGRASLRAFRTTIRLGEMILEHLWAALLWFGGLLAGAVANLGWRGARFAVARI